MLKHLPTIALFGALFLSIANIIAGAFGLGPALTSVTGRPFWLSITTPLAFIGIGSLVFAWIESLMSSRAGMLIYALNVWLAPFGYELLGFPYTVGLTLAIAPMPLYFGLNWLASKFE